MSYQEALLSYETSRIIQQENQSFREVIQTAQILEIEGVKYLEKTLKAPPGSGAKEEYREVCKRLAELTGQVLEGADEQIKRVWDRINRADNHILCKNGSIDLCPCLKSEWRRNYEINHNC